MKWRIMKDWSPVRGMKHIVIRDGQLFTATPCYGMHEPWWVVMGMAGEIDPVVMRETDQWCLLAEFIKEVTPVKESEEQAEEALDAERRKFISEYELEQKRLEFVEWQRTPHFRIDDLDFETIQKFINDCPMSMLPALVSCSVKAAKRAGCFKSDLAEIRFVCTAIEEE